MHTLIDTIRSLLVRPRETPPHVVDHVIRNLERGDVELERRLRDLQEMVKALRGDDGVDRQRGI
jgi:hypothetical protein